MIKCNPDREGNPRFRFVCDNCGKENGEYSKPGHMPDGWEKSAEIPREEYYEKHFCCEKCEEMMKPKKITITVSSPDLKKVLQRLWGKTLKENSDIVRGLLVEDKKQESNIMWELKLEDEINKNLTPLDDSAFYEEIKRITALGWKLCCGCASNEEQCRTCPISQRMKMGLPPEEKE